MAERKHRLPLKTALKMGLSIKRPVRFGFTVFLAAVAFAVTGLAALVGCYNEGRAKVQTYVQYGDSFALAGEEMSYGALEDLSADWGIPCGALVYQTAYYAAATSGDELFTYTVQHHVHVAGSTELIACAGEEFLEAWGLDILAGKGALTGNEVLLPECFANALLAYGLAESAETLIGQEVPLTFPGGEERTAAVAGIYRNDDCVYARQYAAQTLFPSVSTEGCTGQQYYTGAMFVSETFFSAFSDRIDLGCFAGDGSALTGAKVRDFFDRHEEYQTELFRPFVTLSEEIAKATGIFGTVGGVLAAFSVLMIFQFILISIDGKRQTIGILRALGGSSADVVTIFLIESGFLGMLSGACAVALAAGLVPIANAVLFAVLNSPIAIVAYQPLVLIGVFALCVAVSLLSALFPVLREAKKHPVDAMKFAEE